MLRRYSFFKLPHRNTQVSIFLISIMVILILLTFIVINVGKTAKDKTYADNAVDAGALSAASVMAYSFNYVAEANKNEDTKLEKNWHAFAKALNKYVNNAEKLKQEYLKISAETKSKACCLDICATVLGAVGVEAMGGEGLTDAYIADIFDNYGGGLTKQAMDKIGTADVKGYIDQVHQLIKGAGEGDASNSGDLQHGTELGVIPNYWKLQEDEYIAIRERVHDDGLNPSDLYQNALFAGYIFNFYNSGISHRLDRENQKSYSAFLQGITPGSVKTGKQETFSWTDGAFRHHSVTAVVSIDDVHSYDLVETTDNRAIIKFKLDTAKALARAAKATIKSVAVPAYTTGCLCAGGCAPPIWCPGVCAIADGVGDLAMLGADLLMEAAQIVVVSARDGILSDTTRPSGEKKNDTHANVIKYIQEIKHDRLVSSTNYQFHMGGPVKSRRGDFDFPTFYPPVQSQATADFRGCGTIFPQEPRHDARLVDPTCCF